MNIISKDILKNIEHYFTVKCADLDINFVLYLPCKITQKY